MPRRQPHDEEERDERDEDPSLYDGAKMFGQGANQVRFGKFALWKYYELAMDPACTWYNEWILAATEDNAK